MVRLVVAVLIIAGDDDDGDDYDGGDDCDDGAGCECDKYGEDDEDCCVTGYADDGDADYEHNYNGDDEDGHTCVVDHDVVADMDGECTYVDRC